MIPIIIISGFLGAGKTTFLQKILSEHDAKDRILVIENDFGEASLDAVQIASGGVAVREVTSGCICCSLQGNFRNALTDIINNESIDIIYIEPSGVSKLSEILATCEDSEIQKSAYIHGAVTIVDAMQAPLFIRNFGQFFKDQITHCDLLFLTHTEDDRQLRETTELIHQLAPRTPIIAQHSKEIQLRPYIAGLEHTGHSSGEHEHSHHHFSSETFRNLRTLEPQQWQIVLEGLPDTVLRTKGIVPTTEGPMEVQYGTHYCHMKKSPLTDYHLVVIGTDFNGPMIANEVSLS